MSSRPDEPLGAAAQEATSERPLYADEPDVELPPPADVEPVVVPRWVQAIVVAVALFGLAGLARAAAPVVLIFLVAAVIALIINPLVTLLQRALIPRGIAIGVVFTLFFAALAGSVALLPIAKPSWNLVSTPYSSLSAAT